jgi:hypothetical protein
MQFIPPERGGMRLLQFFPELGAPPHPRENPTSTLTPPSFSVRLVPRVDGGQDLQLLFVGVNRYVPTFSNFPESF